MTIIDAIKCAQTEHVVYFLLTAYVEAVDHLDERRGLPARVERLPISGRKDVRNRVRLLHSTLKTPDSKAEHAAMIEEAADVFNAASERLGILEKAVKPGDAQRASLWSGIRQRVWPRAHTPLVFGCFALVLVCSVLLPTKAIQR